MDIIIFQQLISEGFHETLKRLKIRPITPHSCRHTFASLMAEASVQTGIISETAEHESYSTTMIYTHISLKEKLNAVNKI